MTNALATAPQPHRTTGETAYDAGTVLALYFGSLVIPVVGWVVGVVMLWEGPRWNRTQKWIGTLIWPVAIAVAAAVLFTVRATADSTGLGSAFWIGVVPVVIALPTVFVYLLRAARRSRTTIH